MAKTIPVLQKRRGRPATGVDPMLNFRSPPELTSRIDAWAIDQPEPQPSRSEAIRRLVEKGLADEPVVTRPPDVTLDRQIAKAEAAIAEMPQHEKPSPAAGLASMDKAMAENDLVKLKNTRMRRKSAGE